MLELYNSPTSTCSQKVRLCLAEKGLGFEDRRLDYAKNEYTSPEYLKLNPNGVVPTLVHDGQVVTDSSVICEYLDETFLEPPLVPKDRVGRAHLRAWMRFAEEVPTPAIRVPSFHIMAPQRFSHLSEDQFEVDEAQRRPLRKNFYRKMGRTGFTKAQVAEALDELDLTLRRMEGRLADGAPWLMGEEYTLADILVTPTMDRMDDLGLSGMWSGYAGVSAWWDRVRTRPNYEVAYYPGSRLTNRWKLIREFDISGVGKPAAETDTIGEFC